MEMDVDEGDGDGDENRDEGEAKSEAGRSEEPVGDLVAQGILVRTVAGFRGSGWAFDSIFEVSEQRSKAGV